MTGGLSESFFVQLLSELFCVAASCFAATFWTVLVWSLTISKRKYNYPLVTPNLEIKSWYFSLCAGVKGDNCKLPNARFHPAVAQVKASAQPCMSIDYSVAMTFRFVFFWYVFFDAMVGCPVGEIKVPEWRGVKLGGRKFALCPRRSWPTLFFNWRIDWTDSIRSLTRGLFPYLY